MPGTVSRNESLFTYGPKENYGDYFVSGYVPTFMEAYNPVLDKMKDGLRKRALTICERSLQCIFDTAVTGRMDIGKDTMEFQKWLLEMKRNLHDEGERTKLIPCLFFLHLVVQLLVVVVVVLACFGFFSFGFYCCC